jgi:hypothetical protein
MTTIQNHETESLEDTSADPTTTLISTMRMNSMAVTELALTERVMDGTLPFVFTRFPDLPEDFPFPFEDPSRLLPPGAVVRRAAESKYTYEVFAEGPGYVINLEISPNGARITVAASTHDIAQKACLHIASYFPDEPASPDEVNLTTWRRTTEGDAKTSSKSVKTPAWAEIEANYPMTVRAQLNEIMQLSPDPDLEQGGRILLWHGHPGTGKTSAIRALMREWSPWCQPELLMDPETVFDDPNYLHEVIMRPMEPALGEAGPRYRLLIAEDADRYLGAGTHLRNNPALDRLLNVADGLLGQGSNVIVLLTTNSNITEFERFDQPSARGWLAGRADAPSGSSTLAELFELLRGTSRLGSLDEVRPGQYL